jgi:type I restriction enzyme S subunit
MDDFIDALLGDVVELKRGYDLPQQERRLGTVPIVSSSGVTGYHATSMVPGPGVVTGRYGTLGLVFYVTERFWPLNTTLYVRDFKGNDPKFVSYFLRSLDFNAYSDKAAVPGLNRNHLHLAPVRFPSRLTDQRSIASVLAALDDKIDLNRRMNETLEAMARAIFKDWFVDFGPSRAKMEGRAPYLAPEIWKLFPHRLDDAGKPEGWAVGCLEDLFVLQRGFDLPSEKRINGPYAVMAAGGLNGFHNEFMAIGPGVTTGRSGVLGNVFFVHENFWPLNTSLWVKSFNTATPAYAYFILKNIDIAMYNAGSAVPTLNRNHIHSLPLPVPRKATIVAFDEIVMPLLKRQRANENESITLSGARDLLLPKLMSGEIRVKDAEKIAVTAL